MISRPAKPNTTKAGILIAPTVEGHRIKTGVIPPDHTSRQLTCTYFLFGWI